MSDCGAQWSCICGECPLPGEDSDLAAEVTRLKAELATARKAPTATEWEVVSTARKQAEARVKELEEENFDLQVKMGELLLVSIHRRDVDEMRARLTAERDAAQKLADVYLDALNVEKVAHLATMQRLSAKPKECEHGNDEELCERCLLPSPETP